MPDLASVGGKFLRGDVVVQVAQLGLRIHSDLLVVQSIVDDSHLTLTEQRDGKVLTDLTGQTRVFPSRAFRRVR